MLEEGADIIDIGGYSTRPGSKEVSFYEEKDRVMSALKIITETFSDTVISLDTFRPEIANMAIQEYGIAIINDISGGNNEMYEVAAKNRTAYILMHIGDEISKMHLTKIYDNIVEEEIKYFSEKLHAMRLKGVNDVIIDPGFGFSKSLDDYYNLLKNLDKLKITDCPILAGLSRKSMIQKVLNTDMNDSLNGTTIVNTIAVIKGADILRVHDVKQAKQVVEICEKLS